MNISADTPVDSLYEYTEYTYHARGCAYEFAIQDDGFAVVEAFARSGAPKWEVRVDVEPGTTVIDLIRDARRSLD